jgi:tetratricopeptide (TPR) repeat protein
VAKLYLGNSLAFYGLARYNGIDVPATVHEGQMLRIPKTPAALAARRPPAQTAAAPRAEETPAEPADDKAQRLPAPEPDHKQTGTTSTQPVSHAQAEHYYRAGLVAFQKQDLDKAIAAWRKALAADPGFADAQLHLLEAERLKKSLKAFRK